MAGVGCDALTWRRPSVWPQVHYNIKWEPVNCYRVNARPYQAVHCSIQCYVWQRSQSNPLLSSDQKISKSNKIHSIVYFFYKYFHIISQLIIVRKLIITSKARIEMRRKRKRGNSGGRAARRVQKSNVRLFAIDFLVISKIFPLIYFLSSIVWIIWCDMIWVKKYVIISTITFVTIDPGKRQLKDIWIITSTMISQSSI